MNIKTGKKCLICKKRIRKFDKVCSDCDRMIFINLKTGRKIISKEYNAGNPIILENDKEYNLPESIWIVKGKYNDSFFFIHDNFDENDIFETKTDFILKELEKAVKLLMLLKKRRKDD